MIGVIDYHGGNSSSVLNALEQIGKTARAIRTPEALADVDQIILPGVGTAAATRASLQKLGLEKPLLKLITEEKRPFLGICVGYQVLFSASEEEETPCWDLIRGQVRQFDRQKVRVPQIGWNHVHLRAGHPWLQGIPPEKCYMYFVNSYYGNPLDTAVAIGHATYDNRFCCLVKQDNLMGAQFHLEKSGPVGLKMLTAMLQAS